MFQRLYWCVLATTFILTTACAPSSNARTQFTSESETPAQATTLSDITLQPKPSPLPSAARTQQTSYPPSPEPSQSALGEAIKVIERAKLIRVHGFSPNSKLLAYWTSTWTSTDAPLVGFDDPAGQIKFLDVSTGQACLHPGITGYKSRLTWEGDDKVIIISHSSATIGTPCGENLAEVEPPDNASSDNAGSVAPGGNYQAETTLRSTTANGIENMETKITNLATGKTENLIQWRIDAGVRGPGEGTSLGGQWITQDLFLIFETIDEGPLLIKVGDEVIRIASELFGLPGTSVAGGPFTLQARGAAVRGTQEYHIVLFDGSGSEADYPPVRLFHSDTTEVEVLPFKRVWEPAFSPDGRWLLFDERPLGEDGREDYALWVRSVDPVGSQPRKLAIRDVPYTLWSHDWTQVAFGDWHRITVLSFPDGLEIGVWNTGNYTAVPRAWSLDGKLLAVEGYVPGELDQALFLIAIP